MNDNRGSYLDYFVKLKKDVPTPTAYEVSGSLINPKKASNLSKGPRITMPVQIEKDALKLQEPGPGAYE